MKNNFFKSFLAVVAGIATGVILSIITDILLESTGAMIRQPFDNNPSWLIAIVVIYRTVYNIAGSYITAKLAPNNPMKHVMIIGIIGVIAGTIGTIGTIVMWDTPPHWYPITLVILTLPAAWLGGKLALTKRLAVNN
jgi:hypothetical protein